MKLNWQLLFTLSSNIILYYALTFLRGLSSYLKSNKILSMSIVLSIILVIAIYFRYRPYSWPTGLEALGCLVSIILMATVLLILWILRDKIINDLQKRNVALGLGFGLLWTFEISI